MFIAGFLVGFLVAVIFSWFLIRQLRNVSSFNKIVESETSRENQKETVINLEIEVENLQNQIHRLEELLSADNTVFFPSAGKNLKQPVNPVREVIREKKDDMRINHKKNKQGEVLGLWEKGRKPGEIARDTGLGQGEVELILSLRNKLDNEGLPVEADEENFLLNRK